MARNRVTSLRAYPTNLNSTQQRLMSHEHLPPGSIELWRYERQAEHLHSGTIAIRNGLLEAGLTPEQLRKIARCMSNVEVAARVTRGMIEERVGK